MTRGKQKIEAQRKNAEKNQKGKGSQLEARAVGLKVICPICKATERHYSCFCSLKLVHLSLLSRFYACLGLAHGTAMLNPILSYIGMSGVQSSSRYTRSTCQFIPSQVNVLLQTKILQEKIGLTPLKGKRTEAPVPSPILPGVLSYLSMLPALHHIATATHTIRPCSDPRAQLANQNQLVDHYGSKHPKEKPPNKMVTITKLKVDDLCKELSTRGLDITGTKPILVKRLEEAIEEENKKQLNGDRKRSRVDNSDTIESGKMNDVEEYKKMSVKELREVATSRGISSTGSKKELVERLCAAADSQNNASKDDLGVGDEGETEKLVRATKKGATVLDQYLPDDTTTKLKMDDLRKELLSRGLDTTGTKPILVKRLEEAIEEENKKQLNGDRKRSRIDSDSIGSGKMNAVEDYKKMCVKELREVATSRGISTTGSKKELVQRLCAASDSQNNESKYDLGVGDEGETEKLVTSTKKGAAILDLYLPDDIKTRYHVLQQGNEIYDATLNQTNVGNNNNKFYIIQVLENDNGGNFLVYIRWGRVGAKGGTKINGPYMSPDDAISEFESKFYEKTNNYWSNRKDFVCQPKHYSWLEMDYDDNGKESSGTMLTSCHSIAQLESDAEGFHKGYDVLKRISDVIGQSNRTLLEDLSSKFYTVIPHDFGFKKMREFVIDTPQKLKRKIEMVEALAEIEVATKLLDDNTKIQEDPLYYQYEQLRCELVPVEVGSQEFLMCVDQHDKYEHCEFYLFIWSMEITPSHIKNYMKNTHAKTHSGYAVDVVQIFRASRDGETERYQKFSDTSNRMLLWHGSRLTNWAGILSQGLRIAPPEAPSTGYMFGKGVYFADMFSKSANYCYAAKDGVLLLCEVALGDMNELLSANCNADKLPLGKLRFHSSHTYYVIAQMVNSKCNKKEKKRTVVCRYRETCLELEKNDSWEYHDSWYCSTKGVGATAPDFEKAQILEDGVIVPLGNPKEQPKHKGSLLYNEYIVYNVEQIRMRYVIQVEFNYGR
ncbi:hypothetical protein RND71_042607 [Anisodus tanguticus]|uniref:Poly [ADP-ribose] polymerase n=1 Tax=Anisodus tanguticus TaxID=243964 RepID=A0AAE1QQY9_9SOLA|nr:hypothetical protein RND71_042607 [Anisodus tanguticus]